MDPLTSTRQAKIAALAVAVIMLLLAVAFGSWGASMTTSEKDADHQQRTWNKRYATRSATVNGAMVTSGVLAIGTLASFISFFVLESREAMVKGQMSQMSYAQPSEQLAMY
jgi:hypothetical protein